MWEWRKNRDKMIISLNKAYFPHLPAYISATHYQRTYVRRLVMWEVCFVDWNNHLVPVLFQPLSFLCSCSFPWNVFITCTCKYKELQILSLWLFEFACILHKLNYSCIATDQTGSNRFLDAKLLDLLVPSRGMKKLLLLGCDLRAYDIVFFRWP